MHVTEIFTSCNVDWDFVTIVANLYMTANLGVKTAVKGEISMQENNTNARNKILQNTLNNTVTIK